MPKSCRYFCKVQAKVFRTILPLLPRYLSFNVRGMAPVMVSFTKDTTRHDTKGQAFVSWVSWHARSVPYILRGWALGSIFQALPHIFGFASSFKILYFLMPICQCTVGTLSLLSWTFSLKLEQWRV